MNISVFVCMGVCMYVNMYMYVYILFFSSTNCVCLWGYGIEQRMVICCTGIQTLCVHVLTIVGNQVKRPETRSFIAIYWVMNSTGNNSI